MLNRLWPGRISSVFPRWHRHVLHNLDVAPFRDQPEASLRFTSLTRRACFGGWHETEDRSRIRSDYAVTRLDCLDGVAARAALVTGWRSCLRESAIPVLEAARDRSSDIELSKVKQNDTTEENRTVSKPTHARLLRLTTISLLFASPACFVPENCSLCQPTSLQHPLLSWCDADTDTVLRAPAPPPIRLYSRFVISSCGSSAIPV